MTHWSFVAMRVCCRGLRSSVSIRYSAGEFNSDPPPHSTATELLRQSLTPPTGCWAATSDHSNNSPRKRCPRLYSNPVPGKSEVVNNEAAGAGRLTRQSSGVTPGPPLGDGSNAAWWITFRKGYRVHNLLKHLNIHVVAINCDAC